MALLAHRRRRLVHLDALFRVDDLDPPAGISEPPQPRELALEPRLVADQENRDAVLHGALERSAHRGARSEVASHRVDGNAHRCTGAR